MIEKNIEMVTYEAAMKIIDDFTKSVEKPNPKRCLTDDVFNYGYYNRTYVFLFERMIQLELAKMMYSTIVCGKLSFSNDDNSSDQFLSTIKDNIVETAKFLLDYVPKKLNQSSNDVESLVVKLAIAEYNPYFENAAEELNNLKGNIQHFYNIHLASSIRQKLQDIGSATIVKKLHLFPSHHSDKHFNAFYICPSYWCTTFLNERGVNVMISRSPHPLLDYSETLKLIKVAKKEMQKLKHEIIELTKKNYWLPLPKIVENLKTEKNVTLVSSLFRSAVVTRHKTPYSKPCSFNDGISQNDFGVPTPFFRYNNSQDKDYFDDNTCFQFTFVL
uniref:Uncharacterized protein n=2 Tax=Panagrolaimus sp. JU765 TaxID=591449 RepID=A0AC34Q568_9BILA